MPKPRPTVQERFDAKVDKNGPVARNRPDLGRCWDWLGRPDPKGYGAFYADGRTRKAHGWAWESKNGPVPEGLELDHFACDRRICANPDHVRPVTHLENMQRGAHARKTHCPKGHPYDERNTFVYDGRRNCKICKAQRLRNWRAKQRALGLYPPPPKPPSTQCKNGHPYTEESVYISKQGWRECRICNRNNARAYAERKRNA